MIKLKEFFEREKYVVIKLVISLICCLGITLILENFILQKVLYNYFSIDRIAIITIILLYFSLYFVFAPNKINNFIYKYRYHIAGVILIISVVLGYSGSSILEYNNYIQPNTQNEKYEEVLGVSRSIRSDEWAVNTPLAFSQGIGESKFLYFSNKLRATQTDMFTVINTPVFDVVSIGKLFNLGYIFGNRIGLSFWWNARLITLIMVSFELFMLLTNKNKKLSVLGMILIVLSPATQWWYSNFIIDILIWGSLAIILLDKFLGAEKLKTKVICSIGIIISAVSYVFVFYPAWLISFGYVYLALAIYVILKNKDNYRFNKKDLLLITISVIIIALIGIRYYILSSDTLAANMSTDYPGERFVIGGAKGSIEKLLSYVFAVLLPYKNIGNPCEMSSMMSFFPLGIILSIFLIVKDKKNKKNNLKFIIPLIIISLFLIVWILFETNEVFARFSMLYMVPESRAIIPLGFAQILLLIFTFGRIKENDIKLFSKNMALVFAILIVQIIFITLILTMGQTFENYIKSLGFVILIPINVLIFYLILSYNNDKLNNKFMYILISIFCIASSICINPINKGIDIIYEKPVAKKIQEIVSEDKDAIWITESVEFLTSNYVVANGARVINSTNYYPNFELYKTIFEDEADKEEIRKIYNRYAHTKFILTNDSNTLSLVAPDSICVNINTEDIQKLNVDYILSSNNLERFSSDTIRFEELYYEDGMYIYKVEIN